MVIKEKEYKDIVLVLDENNFVEQWAENLSGEGNFFPITLPSDHPFFYNNIASFKLENSELIFVEDRYMENTRKIQKDNLEIICKEKILEGFEYEFEGEFYHISYSENKQSRFEETKTLFSTKTINTIDWEFIQNNGTIVIKTLNELEFLTLYTFASMVKMNKINKLNNNLFSLIDNAKTEEEISSINWSSVKDILPEKPIIDLNGDGEISQEEFDALMKENEELKQKVELNEMALVDAINMLSNMIIGES
ncbi:hypothetical protein YTXLTZUM_CDS0025 [Enterococcus phage VRE9_3]